MSFQKSAPTSKDEKSLMGVHNLSEAKLKKVIKQGGLANPSLAVIDTDNHMHSDYGEISLIPRASMIDARTGRNAGTWTADAWTPTYPEVRRRMTDKGQSLYWKQMCEAFSGEDEGELRSQTSMAVDSWLEGRDSSRLAYWYMKERGMEPEKQMFDSGIPAEDKEAWDKLTDGGNKSRWDMTDAEREELLGMIAKSRGETVEDTKAAIERSREKYEEILADENEKGFKKRIAERSLAEIKETGIPSWIVRDLDNKMRSAMANDGKMDVNGTMRKAAETVKAKHSADFEKWLEEKEGQLGIKEWLWNGTDSNGRDKWLPNTLENASKLMKKQGRNSATGIAAIGSMIAAAAKRVTTLDQIRKEKKNLNATLEEHEAFKEKWSNVLFDLSQKCYDGDSSWAGEARLQEALGKKDPIAHLKKEYGVELAKEDQELLTTFIKEVRENYPTGYFETKFERPVGLDEFAVAVIPESTSLDVVEALEKAGLDVRTYDASDYDTAEENRRKVTMEAVGSRDDIRFFRTRGGEAYGFTLDGRVYIDPRVATAETPIHEYTHLWAEALRKANPAAWERLKETMRGEEDVLDYVKRLYPEIEDEDALLEEVFTHFGGRRGAERLREQMREEMERHGDLVEKARVANVFHKLRELLSKFWQMARDLFAGKVEGLKDVSGEDFADMMMADLLNGVDPRNGIHSDYGEVSAVSEREAELRNAVVDLMRGAGIEVSTDWGEGQTVLDEVNGRADAMSRGKKETKGTASVSQNEEHQHAVIPFESSASVRNNLDSLAKDLENVSNQRKNFLDEIAQALGAQRYGSDSRYATFETKNGHVVTIRLADHNAHTSGFDYSGRDNGISIVVSAKKSQGITNDGVAHVVEFFYDTIKLRRADGKPLAEIVRGIEQALYSGEYVDRTGLAERQEVNGEDAVKLMKVYHGSGADFDAFDHSHMGEGEGAQAYGWGTYVTEVEGIGRTYAEDASLNADGPFHTRYKGRRIPRGTEGRGGFPRMAQAVASVVEIGRASTFQEAIDALMRVQEGAMQLMLDAGHEDAAENYRQNMEALKALNVADFQLERAPRFLYTVEIPDETEAYYLDYKGMMSGQKDILDAVDNALSAQGWHREEIDERVRFTKGSGMIILAPNQTGADLYAELEDGFAKLNALDADKRTSMFLHDCGVTGVKYPADYTIGGRSDGKKNYVIFDEHDMRITDKIKFFRTEGGEAYGFTKDGKIYLDPRIATSETPIHEYSHLWAEALRKANPAAWERLKEQVLGQKDVYEYVRRLYPELEGDALAEEVFAHYAGRRGAERLRQEMADEMRKADGVFEKAQVAGVFARLRNALLNFWNQARRLFAGRVEGLDKMSAEDFADMAMADL
ncbi:MAG: hypothetical protein IJ762_12180, partial [Bacteroidaceae bacterium]|nr:hypothetical protein [Bacteroidaceae bacterium]